MAMIWVLVNFSVNRAPESYEKNLLCRPKSDATECFHEFSQTLAIDQISAFG